MLRNFHNVAFSQIARQLSPSQRIAIIDSGTNSTKMHVYELDENLRPRRVFSQKNRTAMGEDVFTSGDFSTQAKSRARAAFSDFKQIFEEYNVTHHLAVATSAARHANGAGEFFAEIEAKHGIHVDVISGDVEAQWIASGILNSDDSLPHHFFPMIEIGGGSMELSLALDREFLAGHVFPFGALRLHETELQTDRPSQEQIGRLISRIKATLAHSSFIHGWPQMQKGIGSGGTIKALTTTFGVADQHQLSRMDLELAIETLQNLSLEEIQERYPHLSERRCRILLAGAITLFATMEHLNLEEISYVDQGLRDGLMHELLKESIGAKNPSPNQL